jgi:hypothetical protein
MMTLPKKERGKFQLNGSYSAILSSSEDENDLSMDKGAKIGGIKEVFNMNVNRMQTLRRESSSIIHGPIKRQILK